ncbi:MAG: cysteine methyltransferase [Nocardioidaceae bacterium]|nr:cysteine methyltransferase [Nocardioidaceae bacterium]NUS52856.1 cysteine methyltransferase [Nocardioidaceae bacterium]
MDPEEYVEAVLSLVETVPAGRVTTYGAIADALGSRGPRSVGRVMATYGGSVPWWRVVRADGSLPPSHDEEARLHYLEEGTPFRASGRVDMGRAAWWPKTVGPG